MIKTLTLLLIFSLNFASAKETIPYQEGLHYNIINPIFNTDNKDQVIIYEFFGYKCPHCAHFMPYMNDLQKRLPDYAKIQLVPVGFNPSWKVLSQGFYAAQSMGVLEKSHQKMFDALHKKHIKFRKIEDIANWYESEFGVDEKQFLSTAKSFMISGMVSKANNMAVKMKIQNTPTLIVDGKYFPNAKTLGSNKALIDMVVYLIEKEAKAKGIIK